MENDKPLACLEISSASIKLLVGDVNHGKPIVLYTAEKPIEGVVTENFDVNVEALAQQLMALRHIEDERLRIRISISEVCLLLPPVGMRIYQSTRITNIVDPANEISKVDIMNVVSLVRKETIPSGDKIVDIIPLEFTLDDGSTYTEAPLGKKSTNLTIKAMIHTLPSRIVDDLSAACDLAGFHFKKISISPYCVAEINKLDKALPETYLLVDSGSKNTYVTLVGNGTPVSSASFNVGGDDLTESISSTFNLKRDVAEDLKIRYGYSDRKISYNPAIAYGGEKGDRSEPVYQSNLNDAIEAYYERYLNLLTNSISTVLNKSRGNLEAVPLVLIGGSNELNGGVRFIQNAFPSRPIIISRPKYVGAFNNRFTGLLGLTLTSRRYSGTLEDNRRSLASVERVKDKKAKRKTSPDEDNL